MRCGLFVNVDAVEACQLESLVSFQPPVTTMCCRIALSVSCH